MLDAEQIEGVITMIGDMGIQVFDEAPDADTLLMAEARRRRADEDVEEEAEAAASTLDSEFGRTTDPVRMYMREMGSVELLTREGEIEIAKRIEDGLKHMIHGDLGLPDDDRRDPRARRQDRARTRCSIDDLVDGLLDFQEQIEASAVEEADDDGGGRGDEDDESDAVAIAERRTSSSSRSTRSSASARSAASTRSTLSVVQKEGHKAPKRARATRRRSRPS